MGVFHDTLAFPFRPFKRLWWYWLNLIPILGWLLFAGYTADIIRDIVDGKDGLPEFGEFWETLKIGVFFTLLAIIWSFISTALYYIPLVGWIPWLFVMLIMPVLLIQYAESRKFADGFDVARATKLVFGNFLTYLKFMLIIIGITIIWLLASILMITIPVTIPALALGNQYALARFYRETARARSGRKRVK